MNHDSELVQPGPAEPELTEEPQGNQPLPVLPGQLCQMPGLLPCQRGGPERVGSRLPLLALLVVLHGGKCCWAAGDFCWVHPSHTAYGATPAARPQPD